MRLTILSRGSDLARVQARLVGRALLARFPDVDLIYDTRASAGDRDTATPLASLPDKGVFTADLSSALASGAADLVVHSWKDLPLDLPSGHVIGATLERADPRDMLLVRRDVVAERPSKLRVLSSSPRRAWLLQDVLPQLLPWSASVETVEVRGNVPTRIAKLMEGRGDALAVAKAAMDRLLEGGLSVQHLDRCAWMVLPIKDVPTAPAQGALAVEISASNTVVRDRLEEISHRPTWDAVCRERDVLARHGGGCHQALGATILPRSYGTITSVRARSADGCVTTWSLASQDAGPPRTSARYIWPRPDERGHAQRTSLDVPPPAGTPDLWISRSEALPEHWTISPEQLVWAAGGTTWRRLAARGVWVNGCADGLGDDEDPGVSAMAGRVPRWRRLTHADAVRSARLAQCAVRRARMMMPSRHTRCRQRCPRTFRSERTFSGPVARSSATRSRGGRRSPTAGMRAVRGARHGSSAKCSAPRLPACPTKRRRREVGVFLDYDEWVKEILE